MVRTKRHAGRSTDKFKTIHERHFDCLKHMFRVHYKTWKCVTRHFSRRVSRKHKKNWCWTLHLSDSVIHQLRVHLSWVVIKDPSVFHLSNLEIGHKILSVFKRRKILRKLLYNICSHETIINMYMECDLD